MSRRHGVLSWWGFLVGFTRYSVYEDPTLFDCIHCIPYSKAKPTYSILSSMSLTHTTPCNAILQRDTLATVQCLHKDPTNVDYINYIPYSKATPTNYNH